jgi:protein disulfide-isomerase
MPLFRSLVLAIVCAVCPLAAAEASWITGWKTASTKAAADKRLILADFTGSDWCGWCMKLKREVFTTPEFAAWAARSVTLLEVDFPKGKPLVVDQQRENQALADKHNIQGFPTILILTPEGREVGRLGYKAGGAQAWIAAVEQIIAQGQPRP